jgi:hypothetical protein
MSQVTNMLEPLVLKGTRGVLRRERVSNHPDLSDRNILYDLTDYSERLVSHSYYLEHTDEFFSYYKDCLIKMKIIKYEDKLILSHKELHIKFNL